MGVVSWAAISLALFDLSEICCAFWVGRPIYNRGTLLRFTGIGLHSLYSSFVGFVKFFEVDHVRAL